MELKSYVSKNHHVQHDFRYIFASKSLLLQRFSPADRAGLEKMDYVWTVNGKEVICKSIFTITITMHHSPLLLGSLSNCSYLVSLSNCSIVQLHLTSYWLSMCRCSRCPSQTSPTPFSTASSSWLSKWRGSKYKDKQKDKYKDKFKTNTRQYHPHQPPQTDSPSGEVTLERLDENSVMTWRDVMLLGPLLVTWTWSHS